MAETLDQGAVKWQGTYDKLAAQAAGSVQGMPSRWSASS